MSRSGAYPRELRERAVRMVAEMTPQYESEYAAITAVASKLGIGTPETLRKWVRQAQVDAGRRPGVSTDEAAEIKRLRRENAELRRANEILKAASAYVGDRCQVPVASSRSMRPSKIFLRASWPLCAASSRWACRVGRNSMVVTKKVQDSQIDSKWQSSSTGRAQ